MSLVVNSRCNENLFYWAVQIIYLLILHNIHRLLSRNLDIITWPTDMEAYDLTSFLCSPGDFTTAGMMHVYIIISWDLHQKLATEIHNVWSCMHTPQ